ncbi:MAG: choice-of-anchor E domain-containing protein [Rhodopila sp.]|nr:choice-of-anchor E domain-containing protein [Rhodopila sp.]
MTTGTTILQTQTVADTTADWTQALSFTQFDPSLGTLVDVRIGVVGDVNGTASIENLGAAASSVTVSIPVYVDVYTPDGAWQSALLVDPVSTVNLGAYDGTADYAGNSGTVVSGIAAANTVVVDGANLAQFIGAGNVTLTAKTFSDSVETGDANLLTTLQTNAGAVVSVQYDYVAAGSTAGSGSSSSGDAGFTSISITVPFQSSFANSATTIAQTFTVADSTAGWSQSLGVAQFNPALGTLEAVEVVLNGDIVGSVAAENTGNSAIVFSTTQEAAVTLGLAGTLDAVVPLIVKDSMNLGAYDGTTDFAGASGHTDTGLTDWFYPRWHRLTHQHRNRPVHSCGVHRHRHLHSADFIHRHVARARWREPGVRVAPQRRRQRADQLHL